MTEPEVSLSIALHYIRNCETSENVLVSIDGAHIKTNNTIHFDPRLGAAGGPGFLGLLAADAWQHACV